MPGNIGSAEHAGEANKDDRPPVSPDRSSNQGLSSRHLYIVGLSSRHLYIVHSADSPGNPPYMERHPSAQRGSRSRGMLDRSVQCQIGRMLRDVFADVAEDPVPDRFVKLLEALEAKEKQP